MTLSDSNQIAGNDEHGRSGIVEESLAEIVSQLVASGSIELSFGDDRQVSSASQLLPNGCGKHAAKDEYHPTATMNRLHVNPSHPPLH